MAKREQIPPLLACRSGLPKSFTAPVSRPRYTDDERLSVRERETLFSAFAVITLKISIGLVTEPYVSGMGYVAAREERNSFFRSDISSCVRFVPIRDDSEMVVNLGLCVAEAGLQRLGVAA